MARPGLLTGIVIWALLVFSQIPAAPVAAQSVRPPDGAVNQPVREDVRTGNTLGTDSQSDYWRNLRGGVTGTVSIPDKKSAVMVQSEGWSWMLLRNGPLKSYGAFALGITLAAILFFFLYRGRIRISHGLSGIKILRFGLIARVGHWLNAAAFVILALTGLNMLYGTSVLLPVVGPDIFAGLTSAGKLAHDWSAYAFMLGIVWIFLTFVIRNFPSRDDIGWILKGGGLFSKKDVHLPVRFFNFGEKVVFWSAIIGGAGVCITGLALLFPYQLDFMPGVLAVHKMQFALTWHAIIGLGLIVVIIGHIYIGTLGTEGALDSMTSGYVDRNWAKQHHSLWLEEMDEKAGRNRAATEPAE